MGLLGEIEFNCISFVVIAIIDSDGVSMKLLFPMEVFIQNGNKL